jgi:hypothetical protein
VVQDERETVDGGVGGGTMACTPAWPGEQLELSFGRVPVVSRSPRTVLVIRRTRALEALHDTAHTAHNERPPSREQERAACSRARSANHPPSGARVWPPAQKLEA